MELPQHFHSLMETLSWHYWSQGQEWSYSSLVNVLQKLSDQRQDLLNVPFPYVILSSKNILQPAETCAFWYPSSYRAPLFCWRLCQSWMLHTANIIAVWLRKFYFYAVNFILCIRSVLSTTSRIFINLPHHDVFNIYIALWPY